MCDCAYVYAYTCVYILYVSLWGYVRVGLHFLFIRVSDQ